MTNWTIFNDTLEKLMRQNRLTHRCHTEWVNQLLATEHVDMAEIYQY